MGLFGDIGGFLSDVGVPFASTIGNGLDSLTGSAVFSGGLGYASQANTNSANAAIHSADNAFNAQQADISRSWSADQAAKQMDFQREQQAESERYATEMSNTQWQRGVKDMQAAGLSPMLAYMKGGASSPSVGMGSGAMGSTSAASAASPISMQNPVAAGLNAANVAADTVNKLATTGLIKSQTDLNIANTDLSEAQVSQVNMTASKIEEEMINQRNINATDMVKLMVQKLATDIGYTNTQTALSDEQRKVAAATVAKVMNDTKLTGLDIRAAEKFGNLGKDMGQLKPLFDLVTTAISIFRR